MNKRSGTDSRNNILDAALKVFTEYGYRGASMRLIAGRADISVGGLYLYFKNKEDLCLTLMNGRLDELSNRLRNEVTGINDPVQAMTRYITINLEFAGTHKEMILAQSRDQGIAFGLELKKQFFDEQRKMIEGIIKKGVKARYFGSCNAKEAAKVILGTLRGFVLSILIDPGNFFSPQECSRLLLRGLLSREEEYPEPGAKRSSAGRPAQTP
jgi:AcrR family transcriptional regulator